MLRPLSYYSKAKASVSEFKSNKVPEAIVNWNGPKSGNSMMKQTTEARTSNFLLTLNTNLGYKRFTQAGRVQLAEYLHEVMNEFGEGLRSGEFFKCATIRGKTYDCGEVNVLEYDFTLEIGDRLGHIHSHAKLICDNIVHLDISKCNKFIEQTLKDYHSESGGKPYFNVRSFPSTEAIITSYMHKQQNSLTPQQFAEVDVN